MGKVYHTPIGVSRKRFLLPYPQLIDINKVINLH